MEKQEWKNLFIFSDRYLVCQSEGTIETGKAICGVVPRLEPFLTRFPDMPFGDLIEGKTLLADIVRSAKEQLDRHVEDHRIRAFSEKVTIRKAGAGLQRMGYGLPGGSMT